MTSHSQPTSNDDAHSKTMERQVLDLRRIGRSYVSIAEIVGLTRATEAFEAFLRAVEHLPLGAQLRIRRGELESLASLESKMRARTDLTEEQLRHRLRCLAKIRDRVLAIARPSEQDPPGGATRHGGARHPSEGPPGS